MASGINSTFRQVGIATGIALLGTLFSNRLISAVADLTRATPLAEHSGQISAALRNGGASRLFATTPPQARPQLAEVVRGSFTTALEPDPARWRAVISVVAGVLAFVLIRSKDFVAQGSPDRLLRRGAPPRPTAGPPPTGVACAARPPAR